MGIICFLFYLHRIVSNEAAALELGVVMKGVKHLVVCGHSDCAATNLLYVLRGKFLRDAPSWGYSPMVSWLRNHGTPSLKRYNELEKDSFQPPLILNAGPGLEEFPAFIDKEGVLSPQNRLSQVC